ncbi:Endochitinase A1 [Tolypocladium ophioglossoides CBS 100239]|uniref:Endochitinase A1 n=1 Tax=Tolypocladium ophioglossoides (strain CBS 100239) TaxID=1163406 RepID=A0A0L0N711_TOLOC|nr:Endochitinase A1 [Tolypocladium ophioglossoides CBS 100239]
MALSLGSVGTYGALNGYWGQHPGHDLRTFCDSGIEYATVGFVNLSPEHDPSKADYPGINFSSHCWGTSFPDVDGNPSKLLNHCASLMTDIPYCQSRGVKVILSIGGEYSTTDNNYAVSTEQNGEYFADFLYNAFGPYNKNWNGPRPFDPSPLVHVAVDGYDFDIEAKLDNKPYIAMINKFRALDKSVLITGGPQCPTSDNFFQMKEMIHEAAFDALFIQFYNNKVCEYDSGSTPGDSFNYDEWVNIVAESHKSKNAKLFIGLPASPAAAGSGYIEPEKVKHLICKHKDKKNFGGISLWDLHLSAENIINGKAFHEHVLDALKYGCKPVPTSTSTTVTSTTSTTSTTTTSSTSSTPSTSSTTATTSTSSTSSTSSTTSTTSTSSTSSTTSTTPTIVSSTGKWSNSTITSSTSVPLTTSTVYTVTTRTITKCPPYVVDCPVKTGYITTETIPLYTTVCPVTATAQPPKPTTTQKSSLPLTTSTVYTTTTRTVTKCPPEVTNCPVGKVITETIPWYTTVCPVTATARHPKPTSTQKSSLLLTTSTVYTTTTRTVTKCPPEVTNCPVGKVTTEVIPWYTTVCPVKETETGKIPQPTPPSPGGVNPPGSTTTTAATSTIYRTTIVPGASSLETLTKPTAATPNPGCSGPGCPGVPSSSSTSVANPAESWTSTPVGPSTTPTKPVQAGASALTIGLTGLIAMVAAQVFAM